MTKNNTADGGPLSEKLDTNTEQKRNFNPHAVFLCSLPPHLMPGLLLVKLSRISQHIHTELHVHTHTHNTHR